MLITYSSYFFYDMHALNIITPIIMFIGYIPIMLIEKNIIEQIDNKFLVYILKFHIFLTLIMITIYFVALVIYNITQ